MHWCGTRLCNNNRKNIAMNKNPKVDDYIAKAADFAQPILIKLRALVHQSHPDVEETIKWGMPIFEYKGMLFNMAAFKQHCSFGFWKEKIMKGLEDVEDGMGSFGKIKSMQDLPSDEIILMLMKEAIELNEKGIKVPKVSKAKKELIVPDYIIDILNDNPNANQVFNDFSYSHKKEYVEWIIEAKKEATREKRITQMLDWLAEGKHKNWKYENC